MPKASRARAGWRRAFERGSRRPRVRRSRRSSAAGPARSALQERRLPRSSACPCRRLRAAGTASRDAASDRRLDGPSIEGGSVDFAISAGPLRCARSGWAPTSDGRTMHCVDSRSPGNGGPRHHEQPLPKRSRTRDVTAVMGIVELRTTLASAPWLVPRAQVRAGVRRTPLRYEGRVEPGPMGHCALGPTSTWVETRRGLRVSPTRDGSASARTARARHVRRMFFIASHR
jgi:hypothetical protein